MTAWAELLDGAATLVFGDARGRARLEPLLERWNTAVGAVREDDGQRELLQAVRTDWALCDAVGEDGRSWLARLVDGELDLPVRPELAALRRSHVGLFEVFPGKVSWLRDLRAGLCVPVLDPLSTPAEPHGPAAVWEVRVVVEEGVAQLCRPPLPYPMALLSKLRERSRARFEDADRRLRWETLRRGWLQYSRARRADPQLLFRI